MAVIGILKSFTGDFCRKSCVFRDNVLTQDIVIVESFSVHFPLRFEKLTYLLPLLRSVIEYEIPYVFRILSEVLIIDTGDVPNVVSAVC